MTHRPLNSCAGPERARTRCRSQWATVSEAPRRQALLACTQISLAEMGACCAMVCAPDSGKAPAFACQQRSLPDGHDSSHIGAPERNFVSSVHRQCRAKIPCQQSLKTLLQQLTAVNISPSTLRTLTATASRVRSLVTGPYAARDPQAPLPPHPQRHPHHPKIPCPPPPACGWPLAAVAQSAPCA